MAEIPPAQKTRTIEHMNADHRPSMRHILLTLPSGQIVPAPPDDWLIHAKSVTAKVAAAGAKDVAPDDDDPIMVDIDLAGFTVRIPSSGTTHIIKFDPLLTSWGERRERLVAMARKAAEELGVKLEREEEGKGYDGSGAAAAVVVNEYMPPRVPYDLTVFLAVLFYYFVFILVRVGAFADAEGVAARVVEAVRFPGGVAGLVWVVDTIFVPVLGIHLAETWWLVKTRLSKFGVTGKVWWLWVGSVFIEGAMAFKRFDIVVERLKKEGKKAQ
ncbi:hypothetical protein VTJ04DRAFT_8663 [Mycothermus thermophilus]|uniref:uncharacterized protein n=1 Tax=Humicola insolens TaxID=85995 RepID=UPI003742239B